MERNHNPQNSMGLFERKTRLSVRKREAETGSSRRALVLLGEFSQGRPEPGRAAVAEAFRVGVSLSVLRPRDSASGRLSRNRSALTRPSCSLQVGRGPDGQAPLPPRAPLPGAPGVLGLCP